MKDYKYGYYTEDIVAMIKRKTLERIEEKISFYNAMDLSETTRDELIAILDSISGIDEMSGILIEELSIEKEEKKDAT